MDSKSSRQQLILEFVKNNHIGTLEELRKKMHEIEIDVDTSTLSRDLAQLGIGKKDGYYFIPDEFDLTNRILPSKFLVFKQFVLSFEIVGNMAVINVVPGSANAVAVQIDHRKVKLDCAGTISGNDTIFCLFRTIEAAEGFRDWMNQNLSH